MKILTLTMMSALVWMAGCSAGSSPTAPEAEAGGAARKAIAPTDSEEAVRAPKLTAYRVVKGERDYSLRFRVPRNVPVDELLVGSNRPRHTFAYREATYRNLGWGLAAKGQAGANWQEVELRIPRKWEGVWKDETAPLLHGIYLILHDHRQI